MDTTNRRGQMTLLCVEDKSIAERKSALRAHMRKWRALVDNRDVKEILMSDAVFAALKEAGKEDAEKFFVYMSYSSEACTDKVIEALQEKGKKVYAPRVVGKEMEVVEIGDDIALSEKGIREPIGQPYEGKMDVAIMPLLAVDEKGNRLGYGGGYYDRYLSRHPETFKIAYAYDGQVVGSIPTEATDIKVDAIVTEKRIFFIKKQ